MWQAHPWKLSNQLSSDITSCRFGWLRGVSCSQAQDSGRWIISNPNTKRKESSWTIILWSAAVQLGTKHSRLDRMLHGQSSAKNWSHDIKSQSCAGRLWTWIIIIIIIKRISRALINLMWLKTSPSRPLPPKNERHRLQQDVNHLSFAGASLIFISAWQIQQSLYLRVVSARQCQVTKAH